MASRTRSALHPLRVARACVEDTPCVFTLATSDPDPDDTHNFLLEVSVLLSAGKMHQFDANQTGNVGALMDPDASGAPVLVTDAHHRVVFVPNANMHTFGMLLASKPVFQFAVTETNTNPPFSDSLITPGFDVAPTDDPPVTSTSNVVLEWDFPVGDASDGVRVLAPAVSHTDFPTDAVAISFTTLPAVGTVRNGAVPVVAGVEMACTYSDCGTQFSWEVPTADDALGSNAVVTSIGYTVRGVVFPPSAHRDGAAKDMTFFSGQTNCAPLATCPGLLETLGGLDEPNLRYSGVCDADFCDFTITVRACNTTEEAVSDCDKDFAGDSILMLQAHTHNGGYLSVTELPFTVANDHADLRLPAERTYCNSLPSNRTTFVLDGTTMAWSGVFCVPGEGNIFTGPVEVDHDLFQLAPFNDGYADDEGTTWRASIGFYTGCGEQASTCNPLTLGIVENLLPHNVTFSINASGAAGVTVTNNPALTNTDGATELIIETNDLLALRRELYSGVHFNALVGDDHLGGHAIIMKIARNDGAGFVDIAIFGLRISSTGNLNDGQLTPYPGPE